MTTDGLKRSISDDILRMFADIEIPKVLFRELWSRFKPRQTTNLYRQTSQLLIADEIYQTMCIFALMAFIGGKTDIFFILFWRQSLYQTHDHGSKLRNENAQVIRFKLYKWLGCEFQQDICTALEIFVERVWTKHTENCQEQRQTFQRRKRVNVK